MSLFTALLRKVININETNKNTKKLRICGYSSLIKRYFSQIREK